MEFQRGDKVTDLELLQSSVDRTTKQIFFYQGQLEAIQKQYGIPDTLFDEFRRLATIHEFWASHLRFLENQICETLRLEAVYPPPTGE